MHLPMHLFVVVIFLVLHYGCGYSGLTRNLRCFKHGGTNMGTLRVTKLRAVFADNARKSIWTVSHQMQEEGLKLLAVVEKNKMRHTASSGAPDPNNEREQQILKAYGLLMGSYLMTLEDPLTQISLMAEQMDEPELKKAALTQLKKVGLPPHIKYLVSSLSGAPQADISHSPSTITSQQSIDALPATTSSTRSTASDHSIRVLAQSFFNEEWSNLKEGYAVFSLKLLVINNSADSIQFSDANIEVEAPLHRPMTAKIADTETGAPALSITRCNYTTPHENFSFSVIPPQGIHTMLVRSPKINVMNIDRLGEGEERGAKRVGLMRGMLSFVSNNCPDGALSVSMETLALELPSLDII